MDTASTTPASSIPSVDVSSASTSSVVIPVITDTGSKSPKKSWGSVVGILLILAVIVIGAFYAWGQRIAEMQPVEVPTNAQ